MVVAAALGGHGLAWLPDDAVGEHLSSGRPVAVLEDWSQSYPGYHAYYATRNYSPAMGVVVKALPLVSRGN